MTTPPEPKASSAGFSPAQEAVITAAEREVWVTAAAGSGKTRCLVERLARSLLANPQAAMRTVAFTFTRKAAQEMLGRLRQKVYEKDHREAARFIDRFHIGTIDSYCFQALRAHAAEAGLDPQFEILDEVERSQLQRRISEAVVETAAGSDDGTSRAWFLRHEPSDLEELIRKTSDTLRSAGDALQLLEQWEQGEGRDFGSYQAAYEARHVQLQERILARVRPAADLAIAHPTRRDQDRELYNAAMVRLASGRWEPGAWGDLRTSLKGGVGPRPLHADFMEVRAPAMAVLDSSIIGLFRKLSGAENPADEELFRLLRAFVPLLRDYLVRLESAKLRAVPQRLDYQDIQLRVTRLASSSEAFREYAAREIRHLLVDEFQDTSGLQSHLVEVLGQGAATFGVGDAMQSIYRFRHADVELFAERLRRPSGPNCSVHHLRTNYRSRRGILDFVNLLFPELERAAGSTLPLFEKLSAPEWLPPADAPDVDLLTVIRPDPGLRTDSPRLRVAEARAVVARLRELRESGMKVGDGEGGQRDLKWSDVAILFRARGALPTFAKVLADQGIPCESPDQALLLETLEASDLESLLKVLHNPLNDVAMAAVLRSPFVDLSDPGILAAAKLDGRLLSKSSQKPSLLASLRHPDMIGALEPRDAARVREFLLRLEQSRDRVLTEGAPRVLREWLDRTGYLAREGARRPAEPIRANLGALLEWLRRIEPARGDLQGLLERLELLRDEENGRGEGAGSATRGVQLLTIHKAKGLEYPVVVVPHLDRELNRAGRGPAALRVRFDGLDRGLRLAARMGASFGDPRELRGWADAWMDEDSKRDGRLEEVRLLYVACTRARERLILSGLTAPGEDFPASFKPESYGGWIASALDSIRRSGSKVDRVVQGIERHYSELDAPDEKAAAARPLALELAALVQAGRPAPVEPDPDLKASAERLLAEAGKALVIPPAAPRDLPAGGLARALICPWFWRLRPWLDEVRAERERGASEEGGEASERGERVHRMFEEWNVGKSFEEEFERLALLVEMSAEETVLVRGWISQPEILQATAELQSASARWLELPFEWQVGGTRISGRMDALVRLPDGALCVVDYKTDAGDGAAEQYLHQTAIYAAAVERAGLGRVARRRLIYLRQGIVKDLAWGAGDTDALERRIVSVLDQLVADPAVMPACGACRAQQDGEIRTCPERLLGGANAANSE